MFISQETCIGLQCTNSFLHHLLLKMVWVASIVTSHFATPLSLITILLPTYSCKIGYLNSVRLGKCFMTCIIPALTLHFFHYQTLFPCRKQDVLKHCFAHSLIYYNPSYLVVSALFFGRKYMCSDLHSWLNSIENLAVASPFVLHLAVYKYTGVSINS